jgi:hypothetical protein
LFQTTQYEGKYNFREIKTETIYVLPPRRFPVCIGHPAKHRISQQIREFRPVPIRPFFDVHKVIGKLFYFKIKYFSHLLKQFFEGNFAVVDSLYSVQGIYQFYPFDDAACPF